MNNFSYKTSGTCSKQINFELDGSTVKNVSFIGGCDGNLKGICSITDGMDIKTVIDKFSGIKCGTKNTSCPDQLAKALIEASAN